MQAIHVLRQPVSAVAIQAVGDQQHDGALAQNPPRPELVERGQCLPDSRAAGPVGYGVGDHLERDLGVAGAQLTGDIGQAGAKQEAVHAVTPVGHRMQKV